MENERRVGSKPVPDNLSRYLNEIQIQELRNLEDFGWELLFVRRPAIQKTVAVVVDANGNIVGVLEDTGNVNTDTGIAVRRSASY